MANKLLKEMKELGTSDPQFEFKGISMGNPWTNPVIQYPAYLQFALYNDIISLSDYFRLEPAFTACAELMKYQVNPADKACQGLRDKIMKLNGKQVWNYYDIRKSCKSSMCYDFTYLDKFFTKKQVKEAIGVDFNKKWSDCNQTVLEKLKARDWKTNGMPAVANLLDHGIKVLVYAGEYDFMCNWVGQENWTNAVMWNGKEGFNSADKVGESYGQKKCNENLAFVKVPRAGHLVPMDQPELAFQMISGFVDGKMFERCEN
jgi:serine carboxypeptidase-like clade 4